MSCRLHDRRDRIRRALWLEPLEARNLLTSITLGSDVEPSQPLQVLAGRVSDTVTLDIVNPNPVALPGGNLTGWQVTLRIVPDAEATGTLEFESPATSNAAAEPVNYVFANVDNLGIGVNNSGAELKALDIEFPRADGVIVPDDPGFNLLSFDARSSLDAGGIFGVFAVRGDGNTQWVDSEQPDGNTQFFENVPDGEGLVRIASIEVLPTPWRNSRNPLDVNDDGFVTPLDPLIVINRLNERPGDPALPEPPETPPPFFDVNGDNLVTPIDVLVIINFLNGAGQGGEGEGGLQSVDRLPGLNAGRVDAAFAAWTAEHGAREADEFASNQSFDAPSASGMQLTVDGPREATHVLMPVERSRRLGDDQDGEDLLERIARVVEPNLDALV